MAKRRKGNGSIRTFGGAWRHFREWLHPRDVQGRFIDKPDYYVPPRQTQRQHRNSAVPKVQRWHEVEPWRNMPDPSQFTRPNDRLGWTRDSAPLGYAWRDPEDLMSPWRSYYIEPNMPAGTYAYVDSNGNILLSPEWFELSEEERRHVLYRAIGRASIPGYLDKEREELFGPGATYENVFLPDPLADPGYGMDEEPDLTGVTPPTARYESVEDLLKLPSGDYDDWDDAFRLMDLEAAADPEAWDAFVEHVRENGVTQPVIVLDDGENPARFWNGHHRLWAARKAGVEKVPVYRARSLDEVRWLSNGQEESRVQEIIERGDEPTWPKAGSLNGFVNEGDVLAEAYAILADGDALWLEEHIPGLAAVVRREAIAQGLPIDEGEIAEPPEGDDRFSFGDEPFITEPPEFEDFSDYDAYREVNEAWKNDVVTMVSRGELPIADADAYFALPGRQDAWHALPPKLWHVGTATEAIVEGGFKTREQLGQTEGGLGLGGGPDDFISFTDDLSTAENIYSALLEGRAVAAGEIKFTDLVQMDLDDRWGIGAGRITRQWARGQLGIEWPVGEDMPEVLKMKLDEIDAGPVNARGSEYNGWAWSRDSLGGPSNPVFFSTDWEGLAKLDPSDFSIIEIEPEPNRFGHTVGALGEWRLHPAAIPTTVAAVHRPAVDDEVLLPRRTLYRGIQAGFWTEEDVAALDDDPGAWLQRVGALSGGLGEHWSGDFDAASYYARGWGWGNLSQDWVDDRGDVREEYALEDEQRFEVGIVFQAEVAESSIRQPGTAEWESTVGASSGQAGAYDRSHPENEFSVIPGEDLRIGGVMVTVTDIDTREKVSEQWLPLEAIQESVAANPDQRVRAIGIFGHLDGFLGGEKASELLGSLAPVEVDAMSFAAGFNLAEERLWSPAEVRQAREALDTLRDPKIAAQALSTLGFGNAPPLPGEGDTTPLAFLLMNRDRIEVANGRVAIRLSDGTELVNEELSARIKFPEQTTPLPAGTWGLALAAQLVPNLVTAQSDYGIAIPDDKLRVMALLLNRHAPTAPTTRQAMAQAFNYDANAVFPPGSVLTDPTIVHKRFGTITADPDIRNRMTNTYLDLVDEFSTPYDSRGFVDVLPIDGNDWDAPTEGHVAAYVTPAGTSYWNPAIFTPEGLELLVASDYVAVPSVEGLVAHEFAHRLFAGLVNDPEKMGQASVALASANAAAARFLPDGVSALEAAKTLSPYAQTHPAEAYAELFAMWSAGEEVPGWAKAWGDELRAGMRRASDVGGQLPISQEIHALHGTEPLRILTAQNFNPGAPPLSESLLGRINAEVEESGEVSSGHIQQEIADALDPVVDALAPEWIRRSGPWVTPSNRDEDLVELQLDDPKVLNAEGAWEGFNEGEPMKLLSVGTDTIVIHDSHVGRAELELATQMAMARGDQRYISVQIPDELVAGGYIPPLVGSEITTYLREVVRRLPEGDPRTDIVLPNMHAPDDEITMAQHLNQHPDLAEALRTIDDLVETNYADVTSAALTVANEYRQARSDHAREELMSAFEPRPEDLSSLRQAKLAYNYGADFRARVQYEIDHLGHTPLIQLPELADAEGLSIEEAWNEIEPDVMYHFSDWSHTATVKYWVDESGDVIEDFDPDDSDNAEAIEQGAVTEVESDVEIAASYDGAEVDESGVKLRFVFYADNGDEVGECVRTLNWSGYVYHDLLALNDEYQGVGIAYSWNRNNDAWYLANGFDSISVSAALTKGGYEWASDFFTMSEDQRRTFQDRIERMAKETLTDPSASPNQIVSAAQALQDLQSAKDRNYHLSPWEVAHLGHHPKVAKTRQWIGREALNGSSWSGEKDLTALMAEADPGVELPVVPKGGGATGLRDNWHPFWRNYEPFDQDTAYLTSWIAETAPYDVGSKMTPEGEAAYIDVEAMYQQGRVDRYFMPGADTGHPVLFVPPTYDDPTLDAIVSSIAGAFQRQQLDNYTIVFPPDTDPGEIEDRVGQWIETTEERSGSAGPRNLYKAPFIVEGNVVSSVRENRQARMFDAAMYGASRDQRFSAEHLGNPAFGMMPQPLSSVYPYGELRDRYPDAAEGERSVMMFGPEDPETEEIEPWFATWTGSDEIMHLDFTPGYSANGPEGQLNLGLHPLTPSEQAIVVRAMSRSDGYAKGFSVTTTREVAALLQQPPRLGTLVEHDGDDLVDLVVPWSGRDVRQRLGILNAHGDVERLNVGFNSGDAMWEVATRIDPEGRHYVKGNLTAAGGAEPLVDLDVATIAARRLIETADSGAWGEKLGWTHIELDAGDRPMASEVAAAVANFYDTNPDALPGVKLEPGRNITWDDDGKLTIDIQDLRDRPKWASVDLRIFQGDGRGSNGAARLQEAFNRWYQNSHPNDLYSIVQVLEASPDPAGNNGPAHPRLHLGNTGGADPEDTDATIQRSVEFLRAFNARRKEDEPGFESLQISVGPRMAVVPEQDPSYIKAWNQRLWDLGFETYAVEGDNPDVIRVKV